MNWIEIVVKIKEKLVFHGFNQLFEKILVAQMVLGTPGEMYIEVMNVLLEIKKTKGQEYELIKYEIEELINYGRSINYL
jgi:hypothetical protein